jgi:hypothetical protein
MVPVICVVVMAIVYFASVLNTATAKSKDGAI